MSSYFGISYSAVSNITITQLTENHKNAGFGYFPDQ